ncbi:hypothetical protein EIP91_010741 [Steccherinum ochraceum]|uniref:Uncharacterized protein n=1 Tax=Steccherinum ochraceum TaxID=92696 RepID=A0A4R0RQH7_9APHY|nr:hypothetical protein EIP91_010741 [Steccherinum ochraceum]
MYATLVESIPDTAPGVLMKIEDISAQFGLDYNPPHLWGNIDRSFVESYRAVMDVIADCLTDASTQLYYDKGGLENPLVDATWDEFMQLDIEEGITTRQEYFTLPICANDLNFELVRVQIGMGSEPMGPCLV